MLRHLDLLPDLHFIVVVDLDLEVGGSDAPSHASDHLVKGLQGGDTDTEVARQQQNLVDFIQAWVVFGVVVEDLCHDAMLM